MQNREQIFEEIARRVLMPKAAEYMAYSYLKEVFYPTLYVNYYWMDYLSDKGYDVPELLNLEDNIAQGYRRHLTLRKKGIGYNNFKKR